MRVLRIENNEGKGYNAALSTANDNAMKAYYSQLMEPYTEVLRQEGIPPRLADVVSCCVGGEVAPFTEIQLLQLFLLCTSLNSNHQFYNDIILSSKIVDGKLETGYTFYSELEFIEILAGKGLYLFIADVPIDTVLFTDTEEESVCQYQIIVQKQAYEQCKKRYKTKDTIDPNSTDPIILVKPFIERPIDLFKNWFCGSAPAMMLLKNPSNTLKAV